MARPLGSCSSVLPPLAVFVALLLLPLVAGQNENLGFCKALLRVNRFNCPTFKRVGALDYRQLKGVWYEIAATSNLRQRTEAGVSCATKRFSLTRRQRTLSVSNRGVVAVGLARLAATAALAGHGARMARQLSTICSALTSLNASAAFTVQSDLHVAKQTLAQVTLPPSKQSVTSATLSSISSHLSSLSANAGAIYGQLAGLQQQVGFASQFDNPSNLSAVSSALQQGWRTVYGRATAMQRARQQLNRAAGRTVTLLVNQTVASSQRLPKLKLLNALRRIQLASGPISRLFWSAARANLIAATAAPIGGTLFPAILPFSYPAATQATFVQRRNQPGGFSVTQGLLSSYYSLVSLQPAANTAGAVAVFATCPGRRGNLLGSSGQTDALILSRTPSPSPAALDAALSALQANGIVTNGRNPLIFTNQNRASCADTWKTA